MIAKLPKLRILRLTHATPMVEVDDEADCQRAYSTWRHYQVACEIMAYLAEHNSSIQILVFSPSRASDSPTYNLRDQCWADFFYVRADTAVSQYAGKPLRTAVALSIQKEQILNHVGEASIMENRSDLKIR